MGASLLVFANKTDVGGCMNDDEMAKVRDCYSKHTVKRRATERPRDCNSMRSRRTSGPSSDAAQLRGKICRKDWHGWCRTQKIDCSCTKENCYLTPGSCYAEDSPEVDRLLLVGR